MNPSTIQHDQYTLAILAGGQATRMGQPKGEITIDGKPILSYLLDRFAWPGPTLLVTAPGREHPPSYERFTAEATDPVANLGPLRGVLTALEHSKTPFTIVTTVDMPAIERAHLEWLAAGLHDSSSLARMTRRLTADGEQIEPFPSIFRAEATPLIARQLTQGRRSVYRLSSESSVDCVLSPPDWNDTVWTNLNNPTDVERFNESLAP